MGTPERSRPTPAATVILAIPGLTGFEVLMVRRPPGGMFGGIWVFPGGVVDTSDRESPSDLSDRAHRRAAVRELVEETGIALDISGLAFVSRWVTPAVYPRRFDTWFFLASLPTAPPVSPAPSEVEEAAFVAPAAAIGAHQAQQWPMVLPTLAHLKWLSRFETVEAAVAATRKARAMPALPVVGPDGSLIPIDLPL